TAHPQLRPCAGAAGTRLRLRKRNAGIRRTEPMSATNAPALRTVSELDAGRLAIWIFLATELLFFGGLLAAYLYDRSHWPQGFALWSRHTDVLLGTLNTGVLL